MSRSGCVRAIVMIAVIAGVSWMTVSILAGGNSAASGEGIDVQLWLAADNVTSRVEHHSNRPVQFIGWVNVSADIGPEECVEVDLEAVAPWEIHIAPEGLQFWGTEQVARQFEVMMIAPSLTEAGTYGCSIVANATFNQTTARAVALFDLVVEQYYSIGLRFVDGAEVDVRPDGWVTQRLFIINGGNGPDIFEVTASILEGDMVERIEPEGPLAVPFQGSVNTTIRYLIRDDLDIQDGETCTIEVRVDSQGARNASIDYEQNAIATLRYPPAVERVVDMGMINLFVAVASIVLLTLLLVYLLFWRYGRAREARGDANRPTDGKVAPGARK